MTTLLICLLIMVLLPYIAKIPIVAAMNKLGGYDNRHPRTQAAQLQGFGARAFAAHQNSFEALSVFATACLAAIVTQHTSLFIQALAVIYVISRLMYHAFYLMNLASLRSIVWATGYLCCLTILGACLG